MTQNLDRTPHREVNRRQYAIYRTLLPYERRGRCGWIGLLIALYDTLAGDLRRAADAERGNNLGKRCEVNHALLVIGYLEDAMERANGGELTEQLASLYSSLRHKLLEAQAKRSAELLEEQMERVLRLRESWQTMELSAAGAPTALAGGLTGRDGDCSQTYPRSQSANWSA